MGSYIYYDLDSNDGRIKTCIDDIVLLSRQYHLSVKFEALQNGNEQKVNEVADNSHSIIFFTSIDSEEFHEKVKGRFTSCKCTKCFLVLCYSSKEINHVRRFTKSIKLELKRIQANQTMRTKTLEDILKRILIVSNIEQISEWWPEVLKFLARVPNTNKRKPFTKRQIGVFFKINPEDEKQSAWFDDQRVILEKSFFTRCRYNDGLLDEDTYIQNSALVVMYLDRKYYQNAPTQREREEGKIKLLTSLKTVRSTCLEHGAMFQVYAEEAGNRFNKKLTGYCSLSYLGSGMMYHWLGMLCNLNEICVQQIPDSTFYSSMGKENEQEIFQSENYVSVLGHNPRFREGTVIHTSRVTSPSHIALGGSEKAACYRTSARIQIDDGDETGSRGPFCVLCKWF